MIVRRGVDPARCQTATRRGGKVAERGLSWEADVRF